MIEPTELTQDIRALLIEHQREWVATNSGYGRWECKCGWQSSCKPGYSESSGNAMTIEYHEHLFGVLMGEW